MWSRARVTALAATQRNPLLVLLLVAAIAHMAAFVATGLLRSAYPYPIDGLEPGALQQVRRVLSGEPLYAAPTLAYVSRSMDRSSSTWPRHWR